MKIVILTQYFPPEIGAPQNRLFEMAMGLKKHGIEVLVVTALPNYPTGKIFPDYRGIFFKEEFVDGIKVLRYWFYASNSRSSFPRIISMLSFTFTALLSFFKVRKFRPDFIVTESPPLTLGLTGILLARNSGSRHILNVSDLWPLSALHLGVISENYLYKALTRLERFIYRHSFAIAGQSEQIIHHVEGKGFRNTVLFRNGVDTKRFPVTPDMKVSDSQLKIVYAGLLGAAQGISQYCKKIDFAKEEMQFHIYGSGMEKQEIQQCIKGKKDILLHESVTRDEIPDLLAQHHIAFIPLIKPIFGAVPSKIYEAMAAGLPIIFAGGGEGAQIIQKYKLGWTCDPGDIKNIQETLSQIRQLTKEEFEKYRQNCIETARKIFDRRIQIESLVAFLRKNRP